MIRRLLLISMLIVFSAAAWCAGPDFAKASSGKPSPENVLLIINSGSPDSKAVGEYYAKKRQIPAKNVVRIKCSSEEQISDQDFNDTIQKPVKTHITYNNLRKKIDYLVLTKGMPIKTNKGYSVDSLLTCMDFRLPDINDAKLGARNPYFNAREPFSRTKYGFYLATRLDGYTVEDAKALVDRSLAAKPAKGEFFFDSTPHRNAVGYQDMNESISKACFALSDKGFKTQLDQGTDFIGGRRGLMGYFSWGSNDNDYTLEKFKSNEFRPGAIAETAVSTSARTFKHTSEGQSLIADLIESGVTGVKGYVGEPYIVSIADPTILFDRYTSGYNLADSFYMASRYIRWKDIVIGDPLCSPYAE